MRLTPQQCVEYASEKSRDLPEPLRLHVYWGTILALALCGGCDDERGTCTVRTRSTEENSR